jgi:cathepsin D
MQIGNKGTEFSFLLDTGSSELWVVGSSCRTAGCTTRPGLGRGNSDTLVMTKRSWFMQYGVGNASGLMAVDNVSIIGMTVPMNFGLATDVPEDTTQNVSSWALS